VRFSPVTRLARLHTVIPWARLPRSLTLIVATMTCCASRYTVSEQDAALPDARKPLVELLARLLRQAGMPVSDMPAYFDSAGWVAGRLAELLPFALSDKQRLLETDRALERLEILYHDLLAEDITR